MRFGINGSLKKALVGIKTGYDYAEIPISKLRQEGETAIEMIETEFRLHHFGADVFNGFLPSDIQIYDGGKAAIKYAEENIEIARRLGARIMVIGSGKARLVPETMKKEDAFASFVEIVGNIAEMAAPYGIKIAVEPLNYGETNLINTLEDGMTFARAVGLPNVGCMVDFYHFARNNESFSIFNALRPGELIHVHVARPDETRGALRREDISAVQQWADVLKSIRYDGDVTLEAVFGSNLETEFSESLRVLQILRRQEQRSW